jgi:DNA invertase Pin-like site-specific DNA recombinase
MNSEAHQKVQAEHLSRNAFLYVRQSTLRQVRENVESGQRQYGLRDRALALGWPLKQIEVIDCDQGQSASSAVEREGFQKLVTEVSMNRAGIVMGLEVSRLARNSSDWHRLLEICALTHTLLLDEDGLYDPAHFNDRLLLGLKGTMSEVELHLIRARLRGGLLQKARRGELGGRLPTGLVYGPRSQVELDPDRQVQESFHHLFRTFRRTGSALAVVKAFRREGLKFPHRVWGGVHGGEIVWNELGYYRVTWVLACPALCGGVWFWPHPVGAAPRWLGEANQEEGRARAVVCVYSQRPRRLYRLARVSGKSEEACRERNAVSVPAAKNPATRRPRLAPGVSHLWKVWPPDAGAVS